MNHRSPILTLVTACVLLAACDQNKAADASAGADLKPGAPVALVDGQPISSELFEFFAKNASGGKASKDLTPDQRKALLDNLIGLQAAALTAHKDGLDKQADTLARLELTRMNVLAEMAVQHHFAGQGPTEQELRAEYETQVQAMPKLEYRARHILVATEPFAQSIIDRIQKGEDFAAIAKKESMDGSKEKGGELGWFTAQTMVPEFATAVQGLKKGETTAKPVHTQFGYHIIQLEETRPVSAPDFDQAKGRLQNMVQQKKIQAYIDTLKKTMKVDRKIS